jgi:hypothetical protein
MKKIIFTLILSFISLFSFSQTVYRCYMAELYLWNTSTEEWKLDTKLSDLKIDVTVEDEFISFHAKTPTMYKVYNNSKEPMTTKSLEGLRYNGRDLRTDDEVKIDVFKSKNSNIGVISIVNMKKGFNFRYFLELSE